VKVGAARPARSAARTTQTMVVEFRVASALVLVDYRLIPDAE
jgi:hypothetical protein